MKEKLLYLDMPVAGKETERQYTPDELAVREVENYVERVERQTERDQSDNQNDDTNQQPQQGDVIVKSATPQTQPQITKPNIVLPLDQNGVVLGLKAKVSLGMKWLAEWCVMMIKKYPGRVFYSPTNQT